MVLKNTDTPLRKEKLGGTGEGSGSTFYVPIPDDRGAFTMSTRIELDPGASIGYHKHENNEEVYVIIAGEGIYTEEGEEMKVVCGDVLLCRKGNAHGLKNCGEVPLIIGAAIAQRD